MSSVTKLASEIMAIDNMEDLKNLSKVIAARYNILRQVSAMQFEVGDRVSFFSKKKGPVIGTVDKVNRVNIMVREDGNLLTWRVSPVLLKKEKELANV